MKTIAVIPARFASSRFPGKPLANQTGKYLIQHVYERVQLAPHLNELIVATDDERISKAVRSFGGKVVMTRAGHPSGTDRIAEAVADLPYDLVINVQGDEPEIDPVCIAQLIELMQEKPQVPMGTLVCPFRFVEDADPGNPNRVKAYIDRNHLALNFSRQLLPSPWDSGQPAAVSRQQALKASPLSRVPSPASDDPHPLLHLGLYAYHKDFLLKLTQLPQSAREQEERLEQLRVLDHGYPIAVALVRHAARGIDTPEDYAAFVQRYQKTMELPRP
ncbi:MAG: 8-amino-3,8-dideoxy-manno-octulosonate cytidylyltransferase [Phycisphaerae bacterium]|nr:8-amino-3,8-dideoxy-manno-octulosonate cytidylyltransferase [Phycisphaerae bacterium]